MIKAIIFDFAGVIVSDEFIRWVETLDKNFEKNKPFYDDIIHKGDLGKITIAEFKETIAQKLGINPDAMWPTLMDKFELNHETVKLIQQLRKNYRLGLLSNFVPGWIDDLLEKYQLVQYFEKIVVSSKYGVIKPQKEAYEKILELLDLSVQEVIYIDDRIINVKAAEKLGIQSLHFHTTQKLIDDLTKAKIKI